jgi:hypothetical protein
MKMHRKINFKFLAYKILFFTSLLYTWSCIEDVPDIDLPKSGPKLVVTSFITPNDTIKVIVTNSMPINYNFSYSYDEIYQEFPPVENALVTIRNTNSDEYVIIPYNPMFSLYMLTPSEFNIEKGEEYELKVKDADQKQVTAKTIVPNDFPELLSISIDTIGTYTWDYDPSETYYDIVVSGFIKDPPGERNFYRSLIALYQCYYDSWMDTTYCYNSEVGRNLFSDLDSDGQNISFKMNFYGMNWDNISIIILSTDEHYYNYHRTLFSWGGDNPFVEPTPIYSNINGGLGVFSSYLQATFEFDDYR